MSKVWVPIYDHEAIKGKEIMGGIIIAIAKKPHFRECDGYCNVFPGRILPAGKYRSVLITTNN